MPLQYNNITDNETRMSVNSTLVAKFSATGAKFTVMGTSYSPTLPLTDAASITWDTTAGQTAQVTLTANRAFAAPSGLVDGGYYGLAIYQDATGSRTATFASSFKFANGNAPVLTSAANAKDFFVFRSDGTNLYEQGRSQGVS